MSIKDWDTSLKPREKALLNGFEALSDSEVLAIVLKSGYQGVSSVELANQLLISKGGLSGLMSLSLDELMNIKGIKLAKATQLLAYIELSKRLELSKCMQQSYLSSPQTVYKWLRNLIGIRNEECFVAIFLNNAHAVIGYKIVNIGTLNCVNVKTGDVFKEALIKKSFKVIIAHNHPSGSIVPSENDYLRTNEFIEAGNLLKIEIIDHLIVSKNNEYFSFREQGLI